MKTQVITNVATREAREEVYRQVGIKTFRQQETAEEMEQSVDTPLSVDTTAGAALKGEQMELGSPINKIRRVTEAHGVVPGTSGEPSQTSEEECIDLTNIGDTSDEEMLDDTGQGEMFRVKQEIIDVYCAGHTTGLRQRDSDDEDFPSEFIIRESSDSKDDDDADRNPDQTEMLQIYEQQERKRNRRHRSESCDSQFKTEPDDIVDIGGQGAHHTSTETVESLAPLSTEDTEEISTIPSSEVTGETSVSSNRRQRRVATSWGSKITDDNGKVSERARVTKGERQLYVLPGGRDRSRSGSPASITSLDHELSQLEVKRPVQEYRQRFLEHSADSSVGYNVCDMERKLAESWA